MPAQEGVQASENSILLCKSLAYDDEPWGQIQPVLGTPQLWYCVLLHQPLWLCLLIPQVRIHLPSSSPAMVSAHCSGEGTARHLAPLRALLQAGEVRFYLFLCHSPTTPKGTDLHSTSTEGKLAVLSSCSAHSAQTVAQGDEMSSNPSHW